MEITLRTPLIFLFSSAITRAETMTLAYNKGRIKTANYMMLATIVGCIVMVYSGKQAAERGESVHKMNLDWHKAIKEGKSG